MTYTQMHYFTTDSNAKYTTTITIRAPGTTCINISIPDTASISAHYTRHPTLRQRP